METSMSMETVKIDKDYLMLVETTVNESVISRMTLEAQKTDYLAKIVDIDAKILILDTVEAGGL
jgi:hypothetical protein